MKILCCCYPLLNSLSLCFYFTIASSRFLYTCNLTNRKRPEDFLVQKESSLVCSSPATMPWVGRASFLHWLRCLNTQFSLLLCQYPDRGDLHFYLVSWSARKNLRQLCQCPERGDLHFYDSVRTAWQIHKDLVSMPWKGWPPFLQETKMSNKKEALMCQCPERGDLHFYIKENNIERRYTLLCQCPERGDLHFYRKRVTCNLWPPHVCQCPERGDLHFYTCLWEPA